MNRAEKYELELTPLDCVRIHRAMLKAYNDNKKYVEHLAEEYANAEEPVLSLEELLDDNQQRTYELKKLLTKLENAFTWMD